MRFVDEFRAPELIEKAAQEIRRLTDPQRHYRLMEVCGGHTHAIYRFGLKDLLPPNIELIHGPGCPVCVLPMGRIDDGLSMTEQPDVIFTAFGDMMRVPGTHGSPLEYKARGADVRIVYSPADALKLAQNNPDRHVMFFAIGFETTAPSTALTLLRARAQGIRNFSVFCNHVTIIPAIRAILDSPDMRLDAFIGPGHVSTVIGCRPYEWIARHEGKPIVVSGFEPLDMLESIVMLLRQLKEGRVEVENQYKRVVPWEGNRAALKAMAEVFQLRPYFEWRGMDVRIIYSPTDTLKLAQKNPDKHVMFFAIGFETTAPSTALTLMRAKELGLRNFSVFSNHVTIIPAIRAILDSPDMRIDAFIGPGHVSTVIGCRPYEWIAKNEGKPIVVSGFEPVDVLQSIVMLLQQLKAGEAKVENQYKRVVPWEGSRPALRAMAEVFELRPYFEWRGMGFISQSALSIRETYAQWDAEKRFQVPGVRVTDPKAAQCGEVLKGVLKPAQCKLFGKECTPERPVGALMVSSEGSCAAYFNYEHRKAAVLAG